MSGLLKDNHQVAVCDQTGLDFIVTDGHKRLLASKPSGKFSTLFPGYAASGNPMFDIKDWREVNRRPMFGPDWILDQNGFGSCVANGWTGALERSIYLKTGIITRLSPGFLYSLVNGGSDNGAVISDGGPALQNTGTCLFTTVGQKPIYTRQMPAAAKTEAQRFRVAQVFHCASWAEVCSAVQAGYVPVYGYMVGNNFMHIDANGVAGHDRGPGNHCVLPDCLIIGSRTKKAKDVKKGDSIFGHDGKLHKVSKLFKRYYNGNLVRISCRGGAVIQVTEEHPVLVYRWARVNEPIVAGKVHGSPGLEKTKFQDRNYVAHWVKAKDVRPSDYVVTPKLKFKATEEIPFEATDNLLWFFGYYIGNGHLIGKKGLSVSIPAKKKYLIEKVKMAYRQMGMKPKVTPKWTNGELSGEGPPTSYSVRATKTAVATLFEKWFRRGSVNKKIPFQLFDDISIRKVFDGILDADGHTDAGTTRRVFNSISKKLAHQIRLLAVTFGERPTIQSISKDRSGAFANAKPSWRVIWTANPRQGVSRFAGNNLISSVKTVMYVPYTGMVHNFEVEDVNSYLADGVITHNCNHSDGLRKLSNGQWVLDDVNSWATTFGDQGRVYIDEEHLFANGDQADVCVINAFLDDPQQPEPPSATDL